MRSTPRVRPSFPWSFKVARLGGVDVRLHVTTVLLFAWLLFEHIREGGGLSSALEGIGLVACLFAIITLHELGHALMARRFGIGTRDITLLPIGGVGTLERMPEKPAEEIAVAFAGPMVNVALAAAGFAVLVVAQWGFDVAQLRVAGGPFIAKLITVNLSLAAFNLLPVFPMDGGRVLRAALRRWLPRPRATFVAVRVGQVFALIMGFIGLLYAPNLLLIALFVWFGGQQELTAERISDQLAGLTAADAMVAQYRALDAGSPLAEAAALSASGFQHDFPVRSNGQWVGVLSRQDLLRARLKRDGGARVGEVMHGWLTEVEASTSLIDAAGVMQQQQAQAAIVLDHGVAVGLLTRDNIAEQVLAAHG
jgi:Zn-dependent protease